MSSGFSGSTDTGPALTEGRGGDVWASPYSTVIPFVRKSIIKQDIARSLFSDIARALLWYNKQEFYSILFGAFV